MLTSSPRGTKDILPDSVGYWRYLEQKMRDVCRLYGYQEIRTPIFEHTELFLRGIGDTTDIVEKEMYTFQDRGRRSITLRPENTAAVVRSFCEHKLYTAAQPVKVYYIGPMFRYDKPQAGRFRQFHQFGVEAIGAADAAVDAEVIMLGLQFLKGLGLNELRLLINSVGCPDCRPQYRSRLQDFFRDDRDRLCRDCQSRFDRNPMRILDCKNEACSALAQGAPQMLDHLCGGCKSHFTRLQELLRAVGIDYTVDTNLVRGLDYYTKTAFEIQYLPLGAQSAVCGAGRYDGLVEECGGQPTPGIGFAMGIERILLALEKQNLLPELERKLDAFVVPVGETAADAAFCLLGELRRTGLAAEMDFMGRSIKAQMKQAAKQKARFALILGEDEVNGGAVMVKNMETGEQELVKNAQLMNTLHSEVKG